MSLSKQIGIVTLIAIVTLITLAFREDNPMSIWLTPDQQGRLAFENVEWVEAVELFEDPMWKGTAAYTSGQYSTATDSFGRVPTAVGFYNRGNAFMKAFEYAKAINAYEVAVSEAPGWPEAAENLELAQYTLSYIQDTREKSDTGDESELGADGYKFDNTEKRGRDMTVTKESTIALESAEKWMRSVDTKTGDFLRSRFELETRQAESQ